MLDIGPSPFTFILSKLQPNWNITTVDLTDVLSDRLENAGINFIQFDLEDIPPKELPVNNGEFDIVLYHEVMEHIYVHPDNILSELNRILNDSGLLSFGTPNMLRIRNRRELLFGSNPLRVSEKGKHSAGHVREYTLSEMERSIKRCGFQIINSRLVEYNSYSHDLKSGIKKQPYIAPVFLIYYGLKHFVPELRSYQRILAKISRS